MRRLLLVAAAAVGLQGCAVYEVQPTYGYRSVQYYSPTTYLPVAPPPAVYVPPPVYVVPGPAYRTYPYAYPYPYGHRWRRY